MSAPPESGAGPARILSVRDALFLAQALLEQGKPDEAEKVYIALHSNPNEGIRIEAVFQLAHIRLRQGKIRQAISLFHEILNQRPIGLDFLREDTKVRAYTNDNWRYSIGAYHTFPYGISLFVEGSLMRTSYQAPQWHVTRDNRIGETTRQDRTWRFLASLSSTVLEEYGLTLILQYSYTKRESNIWTREYDRHRLNLLFNYRF